MNIVEDIIPVNTNNNRRPAIKRKVEYIVVHNTGNPSSTARNERAWLTSAKNGATASYNYVVDEKEIIHCIPDNEVTWNAGDGHGKGNYNGLAIEICESGHYGVGEIKAIELIASKMVEHNLTIDKVKPHKFFSGKNCPRLILPTWDDFIARVEAQYRLITEGRDVKVENKEHWAEVPFKKLLDRGIKIDVKDFDKTMTRGEVFAMLDKVLTMLGK